MRAAQRGSFMVLHGSSGAGKSTFLDTIRLFRENVETVRIPRTSDLEQALNELPASSAPRVIVLENREALGIVSSSALEAAMHAVNMFVRSEEGQDALVVWPVNTEALANLLAELAQTLGGEALLGPAAPINRFRGPARDDFVKIAERTVAALNEGASLAAIGISEDHARSLLKSADTIGKYLSLIRDSARRAGARVKSLMVVESYKVWTVVIAGTDTEGDVAALTRGGQSYVDTDRLLTSTGANVVAELKKQPDALGVLATVLDARIVHMDLFTALAAARTYGSQKLHAMMDEKGMSTSADRNARERLESSQLGVLISGASLGTRRRGIKPRGNTMDAFLKLAEIAQTSDGLLNDSIGRGLLSCDLVSTYQTEKTLGTSLRYQSDVYCLAEHGPVRLEMMWRKATSRAEIANYVLQKLSNYGKAIGLLA